MPYPKKIVLHCPDGYNPRLNALIEEFIRDGVGYVGVVGKDCAKIEQIIDEIIVGDGSRGYFMLTVSHPGMTVQDAITEAGYLATSVDGDVHVVDA